MTDAELQRRANLYALQVAEELGIVAWQSSPTHSPVVNTAIGAVARAFVIGYAAGVEASAGELRRTVKRPR